MLLKDLQPIILSECENNDLDPVLIQAIIQVESEYNEKAMRYEPTFFYYSKDTVFAKIFHVSLDTERCLQKFSYGLMQIMGGVARDLGYGGYLTDLLDPKVNIKWGCYYFKKRCCKYIYVNDEIACYNAGTVTKMPDGKYKNQAYVDKVLAAVESILAIEAKQSVFS